MFAALASVLTSLLVYSSLLLVVFWIWFHWSHRALLRAAAKVPVFLPTVPLLGHAYLTFWSHGGTSVSVLEFSVSAMRKGLKTVCFWVGPLPLIVLGDMNDLQIILNGTNVSDKSEEYEYLGTGLDAGVGKFRYNILTARGQIWKITRKHLNPMFHPQNVEHMVPVFNMNSKELVARISEHVGGKSFNVMEYTMDLALKTICNLIYGPQVDIDVESESFKGLMAIVENVPELFVKRLLRPWLRIEWLFQLLYRREIKQIINNNNNFTDTLLKIAKEKKTQKINKENLNECNKGSSNNEKEGLLDLLDAYSLLRQRYPDFTEADMRFEILTLYCTERLYREVISVVGHKDDILLQDLVRMPYLDQVIKETLRMFLIVPFTMRKITKDVELSSCNIPAGTSVVCNIAAIHMDPEIYPNPNEFDPERFSPENSSGKEKFTFIPFSGGPRICIAKTYAMHLMKIQIIHVLRNFRLTTNQDIHNLKKKLIVTLLSTEGYNIYVEKRELDEKIVESD